MQIQFHALPAEVVKRIRTTMHDAYDNPVEVHQSDGDVWPCRHCLGAIPEGRDYLILAHRPFQTRNPFAETGPIFLCADDCEGCAPSAVVPAVLRSPDYIVRGYDVDERIIYGTGKVTPTADIATYAAQLLGDPTVAFVDVRSAANNCYQCRVQRDEMGHGATVRPARS